AALGCKCHKLGAMGEKERTGHHHKRIGARAYDRAQCALKLVALSHLHGLEGHAQRPGRDLSIFLLYDAAWTSPTQEDSQAGSVWNGFLEQLDPFTGKSLFESIG